MKAIKRQREETRKEEEKKEEKYIYQVEKNINEEKPKDGEK